MLEELVEILRPSFPYIVGAIKGFGAGVITSGLGFLKNKGEPFDGKRFTRTVIVGGVVGALGQGFGVQPETAEDWLAYPFVIYGVDIVTKIVYRRVVKPIVDMVRGLDESA